MQANQQLVDMPVDKQVLLRYRVLNRCFRNPFKEYTLDDLVEECNKSLRKNDMMEVARRTIQKDISDLQMPPYSIRLVENMKKGRMRVFRYTDTNYSLPIFRINDSERNKVLDAIRVLNSKYFANDPLYDWARTFLAEVEGGVFDGESSSVVSFQSNSDLEGLKYFRGLLQAITNKRVVVLRYTPFDKDEISVKVYPYYLKQYNDRWYLIAQAIGYDTYSNYALDRIKGFEEIALPYKEPECDLNDYFEDVIGVTIPDEPAQKITLKVYGNSANYIRTKPLHSTQTRVEVKDDYTIISIDVKPNYELDSKILSFGPSIEVLAPDTYRTHISEKIKAMNQKYLNSAENLHT